MASTALRTSVRGQRRCHRNPAEPKNPIYIKCHQNSDNSPARHQRAEEIIHLLANWQIKVKLEESWQRTAGPGVLRAGNEIVPLQQPANSYCTRLLHTKNTPLSTHDSSRPFFSSFTITSSGRELSLELCLCYYGNKGNKKLH